MKGTFKITLVYLKELGACRDGQREFQRAFPDGGVLQGVVASIRRFLTAARKRGD